MRRIVLIMMLLTSTSFSQQIVDRIIAVVGDEIILESELNQYVTYLALQMGIDPEKEPDKFKELRKSTLQNLIDQKILLAKAVEDTIVVEDEEVDRALEERINWFVRQIGSKEKVEEYFGAPLSKIKRELWKDKREELMIETLQREKFGKITVSRREVEEFYQAMKDSLPEIKESVKISHILLKVKPGEKARREAREKLAFILERIKTGEDFAEMARIYSEDPGSAPKGGELGFIQRGEFIKEFEEVAFSLKPGQISGIVETPVGYHLIQLIERRGEKVNCRHILVIPKPTPEDERVVVDKLKKIREEIIKRESSFAAMAERYSEDKSTSSNGGLLGWFEVENLRLPEFKKAITKLEVGQISQPLKTRFGYHIIKLEDKREGGKLTLEKDWEQIEQMALNAKRNRLYQNWLRDLKKDVYIDIREEL